MQLLRPVKIIYLMQPDIIFILFLRSETKLRHSRKKRFTLFKKRCCNVNVNYYIAPRNYYLLRV